MSLSRASTPALVGLACFSLGLYGIAEHSLTPVHAQAYKKKFEAVRIMQRAEGMLAAAKGERGIAIDSHNDPDGYGVIGPQFTLITTDRGSQASKVVAAHPNFAAAVTQMMLQGPVRSGDLVAVGMTGSLPGLNIAVLSACRAIGAEPVIITSIGSSMFGATDPELTWLDMEAVLLDKKLWSYRSVAASLGGGGDVGRGLSPAGRQLLLDAIARNGVRLIDPPTVLEAVRTRMAIFDSVATARGRRYAMYVNVGGGVASLGGAENARLIPSGLLKHLAIRNYPNKGVINIFDERRIPIVHLLRVERLARDLGITDGNKTVGPGKGLLFIRYRYNLWDVGASALLVLVANLLVLRLDLRQQLLGRLHPEQGGLSRRADDRPADTAAPHTR